MTAMNFCPSCGSPQAAIANFCDNCGSSLLDGAANYLEDKASSFLLNPDFDQQFSSCMQTKGYAVPTGVLPKLHALLPYLEDKALEEVKDWWTDKSLERAVELAFPEDAAAMAIWQEVKGLYDHAGSAKDALEGIADHAAFSHALLDCALRSQAAGLGPGMTQILDAYPVPDAPEPLPPFEARPAVPVLPPPPPNWQPLVVPMDDPAPAKPKGNGAGKVAGGIVGMALAVGAGVFVVGHLVAGGITPTPDPVVTPSSVTVLSAGSYACKTTLHGGFAAEMTCTDTVKIEIDGDVNGQGVNLLMNMPYGTLHGNAAVPLGWRGTITVAMTSQGPGYACAAYPNYATTAYVYDGQVVNSGPLLTQHEFTYSLRCS
jgi:hypothetical protein